MSASRGVVEEMLANAVERKISAIDRPTPMIAVSSGSPATTNERNVTISTSRAMRRPTASVIVTPGTERANRSPPSATSDPAGQLVAQLGRDILQGGLRAGRHVRRLAVELHAHDRGVAVVGDLPVHDLAERIGDREDAVEVFELGDRVGDRGRVRLVLDRRAVGRRR